MYDRALTTPVSGIKKSGSPIIVNGRNWDLMTNGMLLVVDVKGTIDQRSNLGKDQYDTLVECTKELRRFERTHTVDLRYAVAFKVGFTNVYLSLKNLETNDPVAYLVKQFLSPETYYTNGDVLPALIFIIFPADGCVAGTNPCVQLPPSKNERLNSFLQRYQIGSDSNTNRFLVNDWQYRNEGDSLAPYLVDPLWKGRGAAMFLASNNFADGVRESGGFCRNRFSDQNIPPINTSACTSDPVQRWSSSAIDYLVPSFGPAHSTSITTDQYQNAIDYLIAIGMNNQDIIR
jgi:hypothetical protein